MAQIKESILRVLRNDQPLKPAIIANRIERTPEEVALALKCEVFRATPAGYEIAMASIVADEMEEL